MTTKDTAKFVRDARDKFGLSQPEFGKLIGRGKRAIMRYEQGRELPLEIELAIQLLLDRLEERKRK